MLGSQGIVVKCTAAIFFRTVDWLVGWLVGWLDGWMDGWITSARRIYHDENNAAMIAAIRNALIPCSLATAFVNTPLIYITFVKKTCSL